MINELACSPTRLENVYFVNEMLEKLNKKL